MPYYGNYFKAGVHIYFACWCPGNCYYTKLYCKKEMAQLYLNIICMIFNYCKKIICGYNKELLCIINYILSWKAL